MPLVRPKKFQQVIPPQWFLGPANPRWKVSPVEWPAILQRIDQGELLREVAKDYDVTYTTLRRVEKAARLALNAPERPARYKYIIPSTDWPIVLKRIDQGDTFSKIAQDYRVSATTIRRLEKDARQALGNERSPHTHWKIPAPEWLTIQHRKEQGETLRAIANSYGVSEATVRRIIKAAAKEPGKEQRGGK